MRLGYLSKGVIRGNVCVKRHRRESGNLSKPSEEGNASLIPSKGKGGSRLGGSILDGHIV